ncbi:MAG: hypothetical protein JWP69_1962 [Flaviaesturariibacter sp.]|nr:hypothetical protein [Flaviaesturariibacter sp.]
MINKVNLSNLRNPEFIQYLTQFLTALTAAFGATPLPVAVAALKTQLTTLLDQANQAFINDNAALLSEQLQQLDAKRDRLLKAIAKLVDALTDHPFEEMRNAAIQVQHNLKLYGASIWSQSHNAETATINNIINDWVVKPDLSAAVMLLGLDVWNDALKAANTDFNSKFVERNDATATTTLPYTLREKRVEAGMAYTALVNKLRGHYEVAGGAEPWLGLAASLNALTETYADMLAVRSGKAAASAAKKAAEKPA